MAAHYVDDAQRALARLRFLREEVVSLGSFVRAKREAAHLTAGQLVRRLGKRWTVERLSVVEKDQAHKLALTVEDFELLADALDVDFDLLIDETDLCPACLGTGKRE